MASLSPFGLVSVPVGAPKQTSSRRPSAGKRIPGEASHTNRYHERSDIGYRPEQAVFLRTWRYISRTAYDRRHSQGEPLHIVTSDGQ